VVTDKGARIRLRDELTTELAARQPLLALINVVVASLFAWGIAGAASASVVVAWLGYMGLSQIGRLVSWHHYARARRSPVVWLIATSATAGIGWGVIGPLFASLGSASQQMLVPFFLAGMAGGAVATLSGHLAVLYAFLIPALLPYAAELAAADDPAAHKMAITTLAYAAGLSVMGYRFNFSLRQAVALHLDNAHLVTDLHEARLGLERLVARRGAELDAVMETVPVGVWVAHDPEARRVTHSRRAAEMLRLQGGMKTAPCIAQSWRLHFRRDGEEVPPSDWPLVRAARGAPVEGEEFRLQYEDGSFADVLISAATVRDAAGSPTGAVGVAVDITERTRAEERIRHLAHHDQLTGLPNRVLFQDRLRQALALARRGGTRIGLLLLDLDHFKDINDTLGHPVGDTLLRLVAERLSTSVRPSDTLARFGGDEFALVQTGLHGPEGAAALVQRLIDALAAPFTLETQEVQVSASAGVVVYPGNSDDADELVRQADVALYRAKQEGRARARFFDTTMDAEVQARRSLERELRRALDRGEFAVHYQPQLDLRTDRVDSVEALVRWRHPERGLILPGEFIGAAETSGLVRPLGAWVLLEACRQARAWQNAGLEPVVAVNLSAAQFRDDSLLREIDDALRTSALDPRWLELEITESLFLERADSGTNRTLRGLTARGIRLALDDFGTGYSSLAALKELPVHKIKIDYSFVRDIDSDRHNEAVVHAIVSLGHALNKRVVAEGVERDMQLALLRRLGCDAAQGFLLARPQLAAEVGPLLAGRGAYQAAANPAWRSA
jgi:diguanylate cyclase (GGDEF)-like protein/PAS domain S-box-containing protein